MRHFLLLFTKIRYHILRVLLPSIMILSFVYFAYNTIQGQYGLRSYLKLQDEKQVLTTQYESLKEKREYIAHHVHLLSDDVLDSDFLQERIMIILKLIPEDYVIINS